jgi:hypothetical protein
VILLLYSDDTMTGINFSVVLQVNLVAWQ